MIEEIDLKKIIGILRKRIILIVGLMLLAIAVAGGISYYLITPVYQSSAQILINQEQPESTQLTNLDIQTDLQLINTYSFILSSPVVLTEVIEELSLNTTVDELEKQITVTSASDIQVIDISVRDENPATAVEIANTMITVFESKVQELMKVNNISVLSPAIPAENPAPVAPNPIINMMAAASAGLILGVGISFLLAYLDTTVKTEDDIEELLGVPVLAVISPIVDKEKIPETAPVVLKKKEAYRI